MSEGIFIIFYNPAHPNAKSMPYFTERSSHLMLWLEHVEDGFLVRPTLSVVSENDEHLLVATAWNEAGNPETAVLAQVDLLNANVTMEQINQYCNDAFLSKNEKGESQSKTLKLFDYQIDNFNGDHTVLSSIIESEYADLWKINGEFITFAYSNGTYRPVSLIGESTDVNDELISTLEVDTSKHHSPYVIFVKRPDSDKLVQLDIKGNTLSPDDLANYVELEKAGKETLVALLNKEVFLTAKNLLTLTVGPYAGQQVPVHLKFDYYQGRIQVVAEPKFIDGKVYSIDGNTIEFPDEKGSPKYAYSNMSWEQALEQFGTYRFQEDKNLSQLKINVAPTLWHESYLSFNSFVNIPPIVLPEKGFKAVEQEAESSFENFEDIDDLLSDIPEEDDLPVEEPPESL